jgi:hypothetical protein
VDAGADGVVAADGVGEAGGAAPLPELQAVRAVSERTPIAQT